MIEENIIKVGMADLNILSTPGILKTTGLGSCVGVSLIDAKNKITGLAHIMLPSSEIAKAENVNLAKYADTAIPLLISKMKALGAQLGNMEAKLAGGAQMFAFTGNNEMLRIGPRNVESCREVLNSYKIPIRVEDTGGNYGRTIELHCPSGILSIRSVQHGDKEL